MFKSLMPGCGLLLFSLALVFTPIPGAGIGAIVLMVGAVVVAIRGVKRYQAMRAVLDDHDPHYP